MKLQFFTITIGDKCFDLPKDMQVPQIGSTFFIEDEKGVVEKVNYHIVDRKVYMISIFTSNPFEK